IRDSGFGIRERLLPLPPLEKGYGDLLWICSSESRFSTAEWLVIPAIKSSRLPPLLQLRNRTGASAGHLLPRSLAWRCLLRPHRQRLPLLAHLEQPRRLDQVAELAVAVVARVERALVADVAAHRTQVRPAVVALRGVDRVAQGAHEGGVVLQLLPGARTGRGRGRAGLFLLAKLFQVQEHRARLDERLRRLFLAEAVDRDTVVAQAHHQRGEVGIAGDDREAVEIARVQQVHR